MQNKQKRIYIFLNKKEKDKENEIKKSQRKSLETTMKILLDSSSSIFSWLLFVLLKLNTFLQIIQFIISSDTGPFGHFKQST